MGGTADSAEKQRVATLRVLGAGIAEDRDEPFAKIQFHIKIYA